MFLSKRKSKIENSFCRLERWQQEQFLAQTLGAHLEIGDDEFAAPATHRDAAAQTVWLKFEADGNPKDVAYHLIRLRRRLGLPNQLPIHGPGGQQAMKEQLKNAEREQVALIVNSTRFDSTRRFFLLGKSSQRSRRFLLLSDEESTTILHAIQSLRLRNSFRWC